MTPRDEGVLKAIHRCDLIQERRDRSMEECKREAAEKQREQEQRYERDDVSVGSSPNRTAAQVLSASYGARIHKASYKTRGTLDGKTNKDQKKRAVSRA